MNPKWRALAFLISINLLWIFAAWRWTERETWLWITPIALSINFLLLTYDQVLTFSRLRSEPLAGHDPWGLLKMIHHLSTRLKISAPEVHLIDHPSAQIFAYARTRGQTRLMVTEGLLNTLTPNELEAVVTFQMLSIDRSLPQLNYWVGAILDLIYRIGYTLERIFAFIFGWSPKLSNWFTGPISWLLNFCLLSPQDFLKLDRRTAARLDQPEYLAQALWKMESYARTKPWREAGVFAHMCLVNPLESGNLQNLTQVQPPLKRRIKDLVGRYPL